MGRRRKRREQEIVRAKVQEKLKMKVQCGGGKDGKKKGGRDGERGKELSLYTLTVGVELHNAPPVGLQPTQGNAKKTYSYKNILYIYI